MEGHVSYDDVKRAAMALLEAQLVTPMWSQNKALGVNLNQKQ